MYRAWLRGSFEKCKKQWGCALPSGKDNRFY
jgi:hypothetical protein